MKNIYLIVIAVFGLLLVSCKDKDKDPKPTVGSLRASVSPAGAVSSMRVTAGGTIFEAIPDANNTFMIGNLPPGQYTVSFRTNPNFKEPAKRMAEVLVDHETNLGNIEVEKMLETGSFSATVNGNNWISPLPLGTMSNGALLITGTQINLNGTSEIITLVLPNFNGPGSYPGPTRSSATFTAAAISGSMQNWNTTVGQCQVQITNFNVTDKLVSGTFTFVASPADPSTSGAKAVTNGTFSNVVVQ